MDVVGKRIVAGSLVPLLLAVAFAGLRAEGARSTTSACSSVSGVDRPAAVAGRTVRVLYAVAADAADDSAGRVGLIGADVAAISSWWRDQDPTREPRFDLVETGCGQGLDIGLLRLRDTAAALSTLEGRYGRIVSAVLSSSDGSPFAKYLVYYAGPVSADVRMCGEGAGEYDGRGVAVVYLAACPAVPSEVIAAHELLHALGGIPRTGAPNACPASPAHVCDSSRDILYPFAPRMPLRLLSLDAGRDDYYSTGGAWRDIRDSRWLTHLDDQVPLSVVTRGDGAVVSNVPGVHCSGACRSEWDGGTFISLSALPGPGSRFVGWSGACAGAGRCDLELHGSPVARATFGPLSATSTKHGVDTASTSRANHGGG